MKNTFTYLLLSFLLILISKSYTQSQQFIIQKYSVENGLPDNRVNDIAQDSLGRIWIAMKTGIAMYDGVNWKKFGKKDGVPEIEYVKIKIDEKGTIWFLPFWMGNKFIVFFKESNWGRINIEINDTRTRIFRSVDVMYKSGKPVIWIITRVSGLLKFEDNKWERISQKNGLVSDKLFSILLSYGKVYVGSDKGFSIIQDTLIKNYFVKGKDPRILGIAESMDSDSTEKIIFLGENWLGEYSNEKINFLSVNFNIPIIGVDDMIVLKAHSNGDIFFGNTTSIFAYNLIDKQIHQIFFSEPSSNEGVNSLLVDYERNIWFAGNRGIYKFIYSPFKNYYKSNGLLENEVSAISQFNDGDIVFGHNYGLTIKKDDKFIKITTSHNNLYSELVRILDMYHDKKVDKIFFAGYTNGIGVLANNDFLKWIKENNSTRYFSIFSNSKNQIFVTTDRGLIEMSYTKVLKVFPAVHQYARKGIFVGDSVIYLATNEGLVKFNFIKLTLIKNPITDANNLFNLFYNKKYGLLAGSIKGLYTLKNDELVK